MGPRHWGAGAQRDQLAGHADRSPLPGTGPRVRPGHVPGEDRVAGDDVLLGPEDPLAARQHPGPARTRRGRRGAVRDDRLVADLEPVRPARHRRHEREPHAVDEPAHARLGSGRSSTRSASRRRCSRRSGPPRRPTARPGRRSPESRSPRRSGDQHAALVGQTCFSPRGGEVHLRDRKLLRAQHRRAPGDLEQRSADDARLQARVGRSCLRARGIDRDHRRARAVVPRQHRTDRQRPRDRDARADRRGQRGLLLRPGVLGPVRAALAQRCARSDRGTDRLHPARSPGASRARGDRVADARGGRRDDTPTTAARCPNCASTAG